MAYLDSKKMLERNFEKASDFFDNLISFERIQKGFNIGTDINLHLYLNDWFLFRIEFVGYDAIKIDYRRRKVLNRQFKSDQFLLVLIEIVKNSVFKNNRFFIQDTIIINKSNYQYLDLLNQAIDKYYDLVHEN